MRVHAVFKVSFNIIVHVHIDVTEIKTIVVYIYAYFALCFRCRMTF